jgi:hypothetical protein
MEENMKVNGETIIWRELAFMSGTMEGNMKVNIKTIKSTALVYTHGQMVAAMKVSGTKESSMA